MEDKVIDKGESESPQQAARGPSLLSSVDPFPGYAGAAASRLDFCADIRPRPACSQSPNTGSALHFTPGDVRQTSLGAGRVLQWAGVYAGHYLHAAGSLVFQGRQSMFELRSPLSA